MDAIFSFTTNFILWEFLGWDFTGVKVFLFRVLYFAKGIKITRSLCFCSCCRLGGGERLGDEYV